MPTHGLRDEGPPGSGQIVAPVRRDYLDPRPLAGSAAFTLPSTSWA